MLVREQMEVDLLTIGPNDTCDRALALMKAAAVDSLPVLDGSRLVGMVAEVEIRRRAPHQVGPGDGSSDPDAILPYVKVSGVMTYAPASVRPDAPLEDAVGLMLERGLSTVPVIEGQRLVGLVTLRSVLTALQRLLVATALPAREARPNGHAG